MSNAPINYFQEYSDYIDGLQKRIMEIQLKFNQCQFLINKEFSEGFIAKEVAAKMLAVKIYQYVPSTDRAYRLDGAEVDFINKYADLDSNGEIKNTILKPEFLEKKALLDKILESVKTLAYFESLDSESRRIKVHTDLTSSFESRIRELQEKAANYLRKNGENAKNTAAYAQIQEEISKCQRGIEQFCQIINCDDEMLLKLITSYYKVDYSFYEWYKKMSLKSIRDNGNLHSEHRKTMESLIIGTNDAVTAQNSIATLNTKLAKQTKLLFGFLKEGLTISLEKYDTTDFSFNFLRKNKEQNNQKDLFELFKDLSSLPGVSKFLKETLFANGETNIDLATCFNKYLTDKYGKETKYVDIEEFKTHLVNSVINYFKGIIEQTQKELNRQIQLLGGTSDLTNRTAEEGYSQALLQEQAYNTAEEDPSTLKINGFTDEELEKIYLSLKNILATQYGYNTTQELLKEKRGLQC